MMRFKPRQIVGLFAILVTGMIILYWCYGIQVSATASHEPEEKNICPLSHPLMVKVSNNTFRNFARAQIKIELWKGDSAINILTTSDFDFLKSLAPFKSGTLCFSDNYFAINIVSGEGIAASAIREARELEAKIKDTQTVVLEIIPTFSK